MGKTSDNNVSRRQSNKSVHIKKQDTDMPKSSKKCKNRTKKRNLKMRRSINRLFDELRNESSSSITSSNTTVIELDKSDGGTKRKRQDDVDIIPKRARNSLIVINDDNDNDVTITNTPQKQASIHCSTPIYTNSRKSQHDLLVANFSNNQLNDSNPADTTKVINLDSYVTIDLTTETLNGNQNTVIDLDKTDNPDCTIVSESNASLSISGESDVTVLRGPKKNTMTSQRQLRKVFNGVSRLNTAEKNNVLQYVLKKLMNGCDTLVDMKLDSGSNKESKKTESAEDSYIKELLLGQSKSRNSIGSNIYNPQHAPKNPTGLRLIVIDGSNVAMEGRNGKSSDPCLLNELERRGLVVYTPSREVMRQFIVSYDDRYIVQCAAEFDGVIVSGDNYRDLMKENPRWQFTIANRLLPFTWVEDMIMFPRDPLGRYGPTFEQFLRHTTPQTVTKKSNTNVFSR